MRRSRIVVSTLSNASATSSHYVSMSNRSPYRGFRGRGGRSFSNRPHNDQFITEKSHFQSVHDANRQFRHGNSNQSNQTYSAFPPPPFYHQNQTPHSNQGQSQQFHQNQTPRQSPQQSFRQRPRSKPSDYREWEYAKTRPSPDSQKFVVLSYNILADYLANDHWRSLYFHIPRNMLSWGYRKSRIVFELGLWSADIMCLQEVDRFQDLEEELKVKGYSGIWKMRTGNAVDGCAIFWRSNRFKLVYEESIQFNQIGLRDNVAQICVLERLLNSQTKENEVSPSESCSCRVVICNIHVLFNPKRGDFKLGQVRTLLEKAHAVSKLWDDAPVVLCGDFNCTPKSHLYNFISERKLDLSGLARDKVSGQESATIRSPRPENYNTRFQTANKSPQGQVQPPDLIANTRMDNNSNMDLGKSPVRNTTDLSSAGIVVTGDEATSSSDRVLPPVETMSSAQNTSTSLSAEVDTLAEMKLDGLTLDEPVVFAQDEEGIGEDGETFLAKLHNKDLSQKEELVNEFSPKLGSESYNSEKITYNPSSWTPMEIVTATGDPERTAVEHTLELKSTYSEIEGQVNTRDEHGEPVVTSYHRCFMGTVDYIWRSEGLQTVRVLAPMSKQAMQWTPGFPTPKWGSDHIALVSELAFCSSKSPHLSADIKQMWKRSHCT